MASWLTIGSNDQIEKTDYIEYFIIKTNINICSILINEMVKN